MASSPVSSQSCFPIGRPAEFDDPPFIAGLAAETGDKDVLETCDLDLRYGKAILDQDITISLFRDSQGKALPTKTIREQGLRFYQAYPKQEEWEAYVGKLRNEIEASGRAGKAVDYSTIAGRLLEKYYTQVKSAHEISKTAYYEGEVAMLNAVMLTDPRGSAIHVIQWACTSASFPNPLFERFIERAYRLIRGSGERQGDMAAAMNIFGPCYDAASSERQATMTGVFHRVDEEFTSPIVLGKPLSVGKVAAAAKKNKASLVYLWSPYCPICHSAMGELQEIEGKLKNIDGGIVGVHLEGEGGDAEVERRGHNAQWPEVQIDGGEFRSLSRRNAVPLFAIVDGEGKVVFSLTGYNREAIEQALRKAFPAYGAQGI